jgi:hypothetical protein
MDPVTLIAIAKLARDRAALYAVPHLTGHRDGMERKGAKAALEQLARDLEVSAGHCGTGSGDEEA